MNNAGTKHFDLFFFLSSLLATNPHKQDLPLWLWFSVLHILMLKNCYEYVNCVLTIMVKEMLLLRGLRAKFNS